MAEAELKCREIERQGSGDFFSLDSFDAACQRVGWNLESKMRILAKLAKDKSDPRNQLAAVRYLDECVERIVELNGGLRKVKTTQEDGSVIEGDFVQGLAASAGRKEEVVRDRGEEDDIIDAEPDVDEEYVDEDDEIDVEEIDEDEDAGTGGEAGGAKAPKWGQRAPTAFSEGYTGLSGTTPDD